MGDNTLGQQIHLPQPTHDSGAEELAGEEAVLEQQGPEGAEGKKKPDKLVKIKQKASSLLGNDTTTKADGVGDNDKCTCEEIKDTKFLPTPTAIHGNATSTIQDTCGQGNKWFNPSYLVALVEAITSFVDAIKSDRITSMENMVKGFEYARETAENTANHIMKSAELQAEIHETNAAHHMTQAIVSGVMMGVMIGGTVVQGARVRGQTKAIDQRHGIQAKKDNVATANKPENFTGPKMNNPKYAKKANENRQEASTSLKKAEGKAFDAKMKVKSEMAFKNTMMFMFFQQGEKLATHIMEHLKELEVAQLTRLKGAQDKQTELARHAQKIAQGIIDQAQKQGKNVEENIQQAFQQLNKWVDEYFRAFNISSRG